MDLEDLQQRWQEQDRKLDASLRLNQRLWHTLETQRASGALDRWSRLIVFELVAGLIAVVALGAYLGDRVGVVRFAVPAATLLAGAVALVTASAMQVARARAIDFAAPVVAIQTELESVRLLRLRTTKWIVLLSTLAWTPLHIVALDALFGVDVYALLGARWIAANLAAGIAVIPVLSWMARRSLWRRLTRHLDDRNLAAARRFLASLASFEAEATTGR